MVVVATGIVVEVVVTLAEVVVVATLDVVVVRSAIAGVIAIRKPKTMLPSPAAARKPDRTPVRGENFTPNNVTGWPQQIWASCVPDRSFQW